MRSVKLFVLPLCPLYSIYSFFYEVWYNKSAQLAKRTIRRLFMQRKHTIVNSTDQISLHDCAISSASWNGNDLVLNFDDGIRLMPGLEQNPFPAVACTDAAQVCYPQCDSFTILICTSRTLHIFGKDFTFCRRWHTLTEESPEQFSSFISKTNPVIITEYHLNGGFGHHYECYAHALNKYHSLLTFVRPHGHRVWRPLFGDHAADHFETEHWEDDYDQTGISVSRSTMVSLSISGCPAEENIIYRWNSTIPED